MSFARPNLQKLRQLTFDELRVRLTQKASALAERQGWSSTARLPEDRAFQSFFTSDARFESPVELLSHFQSRTVPHFFPGFANIDETAAFIKTNSPENVAELVERSDRIVEGKFDLLGLSQLSFGDPIDWHYEPISGKHSPVVHWSEVDELDSDRSGDKKILWELNRHQHLVTLGQAYVATGNEIYAQTFVSHLNSWMDQNPPKLGVHWISSLEIAFRSISWLWSLYFFKDSPSLSPDVLWRALKFLYLNGRHLETYLSTYFSPNTHLTGEALGLFYLGTLLPEFKEAERWKNTGRTILLNQLPIQVGPDGAYFEQSSYYHRYTTDFYIHFLLLSRSNGKSLDPVEDRLPSLLDHLMYITRPDGTTPFFGDDDGGRLMPLDLRPKNDFRSTLAIGAALFSRCDYKFVAQDATEELVWLIGVDGLQQFATLQPKEPQSKSIGFPNAGYYVMRDSWTRDGNYLLFDCGRHGVMNCGHAHADALSFEVTANGRTQLVDPGTYTYTGSLETRNWFRSSIAHNALTIDGESSSVPGAAFSWESVANVECTKWLSRGRVDYVKGTHDGYERLKDPVSHSRSILFLKNDYWVVRDEVFTNGEHQADLWFHYDSNATPLIQAEDGFAVTVSDHGSENGLDVTAFGKNANWRREDGWVSHCYGNRDAARLYAFSARVQHSAQFVTFLLPQGDGDDKRVVVREVEAIGGQAFEVTHSNGLDIIMLKNADASGFVEMERLASDCDWTWVRFSNVEDHLPTELLLLQGANVRLEGSSILKANREIDYLLAGRVGNKFQVDTREVNFDCGLQIADFESTFSNLKTAN